MTGLITVATFSSRIEAEIAKSVLDSEDIDAMILADDAGGADPFLLLTTGGVRLIVHPDDAARAAQALAPPPDDAPN